MGVRLADLNIRWMSECDDFMSDFSVRKKTDEDCVISLSHEAHMGECHGIQFVQKPSEHVLSRSDELLCADKDWTQATVYCRRYEDPNHTLPLAAICSRFTAFETVLLHGSLVDYRGSGIVFTGYSGIGKTTQAELWKKFLKADIINGDKVFVRNFEDGVYAYGLPWKGSSPYCLNRKTALKAVVVLRQAKENRIRRLSSAECLEYFMPHIFLPHWDKDCLSRALDTFDKILERIPVWMLECLPDKDAVKLTRDTVLE